MNDVYAAYGGSRIEAMEDDDEPVVLSN